MKLTNTKKGFGILEVLVSGLIIIIILGALVFIARAAVNNSDYTQQRAQAIYLAQEGLEITRQIRDTNWIDLSSATKWDTLDGSTSFKSSPPTGKKFIPVVSGGRYLLTETVTNEEITVDSVTFKRHIQIYADNNDLGEIMPYESSFSNVLKNKSMKIEAVVQWQFNGQDKLIKSDEILTDWRPNF